MTHEGNCCVWYWMGDTFQHSPMEKWPRHLGEKYSPFDKPEVLLSCSADQIWVLQTLQGHRCNKIKCPDKPSGATCLDNVRPACSSAWHPSLGTDAANLPDLESMKAQVLHYVHFNFSVNPASENLTLQQNIVTASLLHICSHFPILILTSVIYFIPKVFILLKSSSPLLWPLPPTCNKFTHMPSCRSPQYKLCIKHNTNNVRPSF